MNKSCPSKKLCLLRLLASILCHQISRQVTSLVDMAGAVCGGPYIWRHPAQQKDPGLAHDAGGSGAGDRAGHTATASGIPPSCTQMCLHPNVLGRPTSRSCYPVAATCALRVVKNLSKPCCVRPQLKAKSCYVPFRGIGASHKFSHKKAATSATFAASAKYLAHTRVYIWKLLTQYTLVWSKCFALSAKVAEVAASLWEVYWTVACYALQVLHPALVTLKMFANRV